MIPTKSSNIPQWIAGIAVAIYAVNNPTSAAELVNTVVSAIATFANTLG